MTLAKDQLRFKEKPALKSPILSTTVCGLAA